MSIGTNSGARVYICATATQATSQSALAALSFTEIKHVESVGELGPQSQDVTFTPLDGSSVQHLKGSTDNGAIAIVCARNPLDAGQLAAITAASGTNKLEYAFKIVLSDGADANDTDTTYYVRGPVMSARNNGGGANDVTKLTFNVGLNVFIEDISEAVS